MEHSAGNSPLVVIVTYCQVSPFAARETAQLPVGCTPTQKHPTVTKALTHTLHHHSRTAIYTWWNTIVSRIVVDSLSNNSCQVPDLSAMVMVMGLWQPKLKLLLRHVYNVPYDVRRCVSYADQPESHLISLFLFLHIDFTWHYLWWRCRHFGNALFINFSAKLFSRHGLIIIVLKYLYVNRCKNIPYFIYIVDSCLSIWSCTKLQEFFHDLNIHNMHHLEKLVFLQMSDH